MSRTQIDPSLLKTIPPSVLTGTGKVVQVVMATNATPFTVSGANVPFTNTNLSAQITPLFSTSRILIIASATDGGGISGTTSASTITGTANGRLSNANGFSQLSAVDAAQTTLVYLDSPATTAQQTYTVQIATGGSSHSHTWGIGSTTQTMILIEVAS